MVFIISVWSWYLYSKCFILEWNEWTIKFQGWLVHFSHLFNSWWWILRWWDLQFMRTFQCCFFIRMNF
jgi:hypothetical protein